jgi:microcystin-dependent protein
MVGHLMTFRDVLDDGTVRVTGAAPPVGGSIPTTANVVSYSGSAGLQSTNVEAALDELDAEKSPIVHTHDDRYFTEVEVTNLLAGKSDTGHNHAGVYAPVVHNHDNLYFTELEVTNLLAGKSNVGHDHDDRYFTEAEVNQKIAEALATAQLHANPSFDLVTMSTDGPGNSTVTARPYPDSWDNFWSNGSGADAPVLEAVTTDTRLGSGYAMKMQLPTVLSGVSLMPPAFSAPPGSFVQFEAWVKGNGPRAFLSLNTNVNVDPGFFVEGTAGVDSAIVVPGSTYQRLSVGFTLPGNHNRVRLMIRGYGDGSGTPGTLFWDDTKSSLQIIPPSSVVTGEIKMWPTATAPSGYLLCNGGTFSATTYPELAALLGDRFGTHSGDTYYLPDFRARSPIGAGSAVPAVGGNSYSLGQKWGHELLQAHTHIQNPHYHSFVEGDNNTNAQFTVAGGTGMDNKVNRARNTDSTTAVNQSTGGGNAQNVHPVLGINFIIKAA